MVLIVVSNSLKSFGDAELKGKVTHLLACAKFKRSNLQLTNKIFGKLVARSLFEIQIGYDSENKKTSCQMYH